MAVVVVDVGKTNAKLTLAERDGGRVLDARSMANETVRGGLYPHCDVERLWSWMLGCLREFAREAPVGDIVPVAHGAAAALIAGDGLALPVLDYEFGGPEAVSPGYDALRCAFDRTYSPALPGGLNLGRQLYWQQETFPERFAATRAIVAWPQYWSWRLSGVAASEATSYGAHSDLWDVGRGGFAPICDARGWSALLPARRNAWDVLGPPTGEVLAATGLPRACRVRCGVHDSNASLAPYLGQGEGARATVISTGTWAITFSLGGGLDRLDEHRDCLANIDVFGRPVPSARFMGGREFELLVEGLPDTAAGVEHLAALYRAEPAILPTLTPGIGPFGAAGGGWVDAGALDDAPRRAAAGLYLAALAATCRELTDGCGPIAVEGPFADNDAFAQALADITGEEVRCMASTGGTVAGALALAGDPAEPRDPPGPASIAGPRPEERAAAAAYLDRWSGRARARAIRSSRRAPR